MTSLKLLVQQLQHHIKNAALINTAVSNATVGWQIEHALLTINQIIRAAEASNSINYKWTISLPRLVVFAKNKIPRGRAKAPKVVQPRETVTETSIKIELERTLNLIELLPKLHPNNYFEHPFFGKLNVKQTIKFLCIHTKHHLHIINDIVKANK